MVDSGPDGRHGNRFFKKIGQGGATMARPRTENLLWQRWLAARDRGPRRAAVIDAHRGETCTAGALTRRARELAAALDGRRPGERIAFSLPNGPDWLAFFLALQSRGLTAVPFDGALPLPAALDLARQLRVHALYKDGRFHDPGVTPARRAPNLCCLKVTSGTAAAPKTVACRAGHLLADGRNVISTMGLRPADRHLAVIPLGHSYGLGNLVMPLILQGATLVTGHDYVPRQLADWIARHRVTVLPLVPALFRVLAALPPGADLKPARLAISAGAVLSPEIAHAFFARHKIRIHNFYGSSETGGICYDRSGAASLVGRSVGRPLRGAAVTLSGGRVAVAGPAVATRTGRWRLADAGEWNTRGELVLLGRAGRGANIGGKKVHPLEIERALRALPGVADATVWRVEATGRELLAAAVETTRPRAELERELAARLPAWKLPKHLLVLPELPRTPRGKIDHAKVRALF
jgi:acyl-coenzyme A synthetase/AMP-(fatty) acid ligase